ncbi:RimK family alpha-L-glutamate ligase [Streptomyces sp. NBC_00400]|uniref:ATP-grasp domain-containing protein n=1 Tax=Streptomyces sp. NBC_00400 TaxID=2975737 RepID=UPI002E1C8206
MKIGVLAWDHGEEDPDSVSLETFGRELGHETVLFTLDEVDCIPARHGSDVTLLGQPARSFDVVLSRAQLRPESFQRDLEMLTLVSGVPELPVLDPADVWVGAESKYIMMQKLGDAGVPVPPSRSCRTPEQVADAWREWGPVVHKPSGGWGGTDVERIVDDLPSALPTVEKMLARYGSLVVQPYYPSPEGDLRITVVGDAPSLSFRRIPQGDQWRANVNQGAQTEIVEPPAELVPIAVKAAQAMGLTVAGVDFLPTPDGYRVLEVNNCPGGFFLLEPEERMKPIAQIYDWAEKVVAETRHA